VTGYRLGDRGLIPGGGWELFLTPCPDQPPIQWVPGALSLQLKWPGHEANCPLSSSAKVKNMWSYTSIPPIRIVGVDSQWGWEFFSSPLHLEQL